MPWVSLLSASPPLGVGWGVPCGLIFPGLGLGATWRLRLGPQPPYLPLPRGPGTAMDGQLPLVLLLLLVASGLRGQGPEPGGPEEEPPEEEEVPEEDRILVLSQRTLGLALRKHRTLLVQFCECTRPVGWGTHQGCPGCSAPHPVDPQEASPVSPQPP